MFMRRLSRVFDVLQKGTPYTALCYSSLQSLSPTAPPSSQVPSPGPSCSFFSLAAPHSRGYSRVSDPPSSSREDAAQLLQSISAFQLRNRLEELSEHQLFLPYKDLLKEVKNSGADLSEKGAEELAQALVTAGVVFRYKDIIYLRPGEVSRMVLGNLPHEQKEMEDKLESLKAQLAPMADLKREIREQARNRSKFYLNMGLLFLLGQFGGFYWCTFHELSWDVMEPVAYFATLGYGILTYIYFLVKHEDFDYLGFRKRMETDHESNEERKRNFNEVRYKKLLRDVERYERYLGKAKAEVSTLESIQGGVIVGRAGIVEAQVAPENK